MEWQKDFPDMQGSRHMCLRQSERQKRGKGIRGSGTEPMKAPRAVERHGVMNKDREPPLVVYN